MTVCAAGFTRAFSCARAEPPVALILCTLLVLAALAIKPLLSNLGEATLKDAIARNDTSFI